MVIFEVLNLVSGCFSLTTTKSTDCKETLTNNRFSNYCNRKSHHGVKDKNFAKIVLDYTLLVIFEVLNLVLNNDDNDVSQFMINFFARIYSFKLACSFSACELSYALLDLSSENLLADIRKRTWLKQHPAISRSHPVSL